MEKKSVEYQIIEIPTGTKFIEAWNIPQWIAECLVSIPDTPPLMVHLKKTTAEKEADLSDEDIWWLQGIWANLDIPKGWNMTQGQFALCRKAFEEAPDRPEWELGPQFRDYRNEAKAERIKIALLHRKRINAAIQGGSLRALTQDRDIAHKLESGALIHVDEARAHLRPIGFELREKQIIEQVATISTEKPLQRHRSQEDGILRVISRLGYEPKKLPRAKAGKAGVKAEVRKEFNFPSEVFVSHGVFEKAWERLRQQKEIQDSE